MTEPQNESIFELYEPTSFYYNRKKQDDIIVAPTTGSAGQLNTGGARISFEINNTSSFLLLSKAFFRCDFRISNQADNGLPVNTITLEHNFFPRLFSQFVLEAGSNQIEVISNPGEYDTILKSILYPKDYNEVSGWIPDTGDGNFVGDLEAVTAAADAAGVRTAAQTATERLNDKNLNQGFIKRRNIYNNLVTVDANPPVPADRRYGYYINWPLHPLCGYLDRQKVTINLPYKITLTRNLNDTNIFYGAANSNAKLTITRLELHIPQITPSIEVETKLMNSLTKDIKFTYLKRNAIPKYTFTESSKDWNISNTTNVPRYIFVAFKQGASAFTTNNAKFFIKGDNPAGSQITRIQVRLNQDRYPLEPITINPITYDANEAYHHYQEMCRSFQVIPQFDPVNFITNYPIFCFDVSAHSENLIKNGVQITVHIEKSTAVEVQAFCLVLEETENIIKVLDRRMTRVE